MSSLDVTPHGYVIDVYPRGYSAYQVALQNGFVGTEVEWLASLAGLSWKNEVRLATTAAGTLASSFANGSTVDSVTLATNDRILIKDQAAPAENGIYTVNASGAPTRATDADAVGELNGAAVFVTNGTTNGGTRWVCSTTGVITPGSTSITFVSFGGVAAEFVRSSTIPQAVVTVSGGGVSLSMPWSAFGVTDTGDAYYNDQGVAAADRALLQFDPDTDLPLLIRIGE